MVIWEDTACRHEQISIDFTVGNALINELMAATHTWEPLPVRTWPV